MKMFDYINRVKLTLPFSVYEGTWTHLMIHKYMGSIVAFSISKSVKTNEEQKEMTSGFQLGIVCKC